MKRVLLLVALLAGCETSAPQSGPLIKDETMSAYVKCNTFAAQSYARQQGDVLSLAIAAEASCSRFMADMMDEVNAKRGPGFALRMRDTLKRQMVEANAGNIARARS